MSGPRFETKPCADCGTNFESFMGIWEVCDRCSSKRYDARMTKAREGRNYTIQQLGGMCPTQAQGMFADGRPYYFRARHGGWMLRVGKPGEPDDYGEWADHGEVIAAGDDATHGSMSDESVLAILDEAAKEAAS